MSALSSAEAAIETAIPAVRGAKLAVYAVLALIVLGLLAFAGWWFFVRPRAAQTQAAAARVEAATSQATAGVAQDALKLRIQVDQQHVAIDTITRTNDHAIQSAPGAAVAIDPALASAGRRALCMRSAYRAEPECIALRGDGGSVGAARGNPGGSAPGE